jgi:hypothetical protein
MNSFVPIAFNPQKSITKNAFVLNILLSIRSSRMTYRAFAVIILLLCSSCSLDQLTQTAYEMGNNYACNEHEPNHFDKVRDCIDSELSYSEYKTARQEKFSD